MVYNAIIANGKPPKYYVDKYCDQLEKEIEERERLRKEERAKAQKGSDVRIANGETPALRNSISSTKGYELIMSGTWPAGNAELRRRCEQDQRISDLHRYRMPDGSEFYAPLKFSDNLRIRVANPDDNEIWKTWLDSRTVIVRKDTVRSRGRRIKKLKIVPNCELLMRLPPNFNNSYLEISDEIYELLECREFNLSDVRHNVEQTEEEAVNDPLWLAASEDDMELLRNYGRTAFTKFSGKGMAFYVDQNNLTNAQVRPLYVDNSGSSSNAFGNSGISVYSRFLLVSQAPQR